MAENKDPGGPQYRLLVDHYIADRLLPAGTLIGAGTAVPYTDADGNPVPPSRQMEPLNEAAAGEVSRLPGGSPFPVEELPIKGAR
jgi:hypothetical protein